MKHTLEELKERLDYNPETGIFTWKSSRFKTKVGQVAGAKHSNGYIHICVDGKKYRAHRLAWMFIHGEILDDLLIDHRNRIRDDNRIINLRLCNHRSNSFNSKLYSTNSSGYRGVHREKNGKWRARLSKRINGNCREVHLGTYDTPEEAHAVYIAAAIEHFGRDFIGEIKSGKKK